MNSPSYKERFSRLYSVETRALLATMLAGLHLRVLAHLALSHVLVGLVAGIAFLGPAVTPVFEGLDANGWTPKPTSEARPIRELLRRQSEDVDAAFCGYIEGDPGMRFLLPVFVNPQPDNLISLSFKCSILEKL